VVDRATLQEGPLVTASKPYWATVSGDGKSCVVSESGADQVTATFVNLNQSAFKSVIVQGGAYAEHQLLSVSDGKTTTQVNASSFPLRLAPGAGARLTIRMKRFANDPTLSFPWEATVADLGEIPILPAGEH